MSTKTKAISAKSGKRTNVPAFGGGTLPVYSKRMKALARGEAQAALADLGKVLKSKVDEDLFEMIITYLALSNEIRRIVPEDYYASRPLPREDLLESVKAARFLIQRSDSASEATDVSTDDEPAVCTSDFVEFAEQGHVLAALLWRKASLKLSEELKEMLLVSCSLDCIWAQVAPDKFNRVPGTDATLENLLDQVERAENILVGETKKQTEVSHV